MGKERDMGKRREGNKEEGGEGKGEGKEKEKEKVRGKREGKGRTTGGPPQIFRQHDATAERHKLSCCYGEHASCLRTKSITANVYSSQSKLFTYTIHNKVYIKQTSHFTSSAVTLLSMRTCLKSLY